MQNEHLGTTYSIQPISERRVYKIQCACQKLMHVNWRIEGLKDWRILQAHMNNHGASGFIQETWEDKIEKVKTIASKRIRITTMPPPKNHVPHYKMNLQIKWQLKEAAHSLDLNQPQKHSHGWDLSEVLFHSHQFVYSDILFPLSMQIWCASQVLPLSNLIHEFQAANKCELKHILLISNIQRRMNLKGNTWAIQ